MCKKVILIEDSKKKQIMIFFRMKEVFKKHDRDT